MISASRYVAVLVTAPNLKVARRIARAVVEANLAACANLLPGIESHYRWQGRLEKSSEVLLLIKTSKPRLPALESRIAELHPYDTPEIIALPLHAGSARYLAWLQQSVAPVSSAPDQPRPKSLGPTRRPLAGPITVPVG